MQYIIEIVQYDNDGTFKLLHRFTSDANSPARLKAKAETLLRRVRSANGAIIKDYRGQEIYSWRTE